MPVEGTDGPLSIKRIFLMTVDGLTESGIIERPSFLGGKGYGGQRFVQLTDGRQPEHFPDYGIPRAIANLIRQTLWIFIVRGS